MQIPILTDEEKLLKMMGLNPAILTEEQKQKSLSDVLTILDFEVSQRVADQLNDEQLQQLDTLIDGGDEKAIGDWLNQNVPNYHQIIEEEAQKMKDDFDQLGEKMRQQ